MYKKLLFVLVSIVITFTVFFTYQVRYGQTFIDKDGYVHHVGSPANDNYTHSRMILGMYENITTSGIKLFFKNIDFTLNFPLYQYYNFSPYFISSFFIFLTKNPFQAYILSYLIPLLMSSIGIYLINKEKNNSLVKTLTSISIYSLSPYLIQDILGRNAMSEVWAICLLPTLFYFTKIILTSRSTKISDILLFTVIATIFLTSHNITIFYGLFFFLIYFVVLFLQKKIIIRKKILFLILPLVLSSFYLIPIFFDKNFLEISNHLPNPNDASYLSRIDTIFYPYPHSTKGPDNFPMQIGIASTFLILYFIYKRKLLFIIWIVILIIPISFPIWDYIPKIFHTIQFPYRLLGFFILFVDIFYILTPTSKVIDLIVTLIALISAIPYLNFPNNYTQSIFSYKANYRNNYYYFKSQTDSTNNNNDQKILVEYLNNSTVVKKVMDIKIEKNASFALLDTTPSNLNKTIFVKSVNQTSTNLFLYVDISNKDPLQNDLYVYKLSRQINTFSFCNNKTNTSYSFRIVNFDKNPKFVDSLEIYTSENRIITSGGIAYISTCDFSQNPIITFRFTGRKTTGKIAIPYFYYPYNTIYKNGQKVTAQEPLLGDDNKPYILIENVVPELDEQNYTVIDGIFPFPFFY